MKHHFQMSTAVVALIAANTHAQILTSSGRGPQILSVEQFGMPHDATFVFCQGDICPQRSLKHLAMPQLASAPHVTTPPRVEAAPPPQDLFKKPESDEVLLISPTPKTAPKPIHKSLKWRKSKVDIDCKPMTKK